MNKDQCFYIGVVSKLHGYKGDVVIALDVDEPEKYELLESVLLEIKGKLTPFFIESCKSTGKQQVICTIQDVISSEQASKLMGAPVYLPLTMLPKLQGNKFYFHEVIGFTVTDKSAGILGTITEIVEIPNNPLLSIDHSGSEILLPIKDQIILEVNRAEKSILVNAPEGLLDVYIK